MKKIMVVIFVAMFGLLLGGTAAVVPQQQVPPRVTGVIDDTKSQPPATQEQPAEKVQEPENKPVVDIPVVTPSKPKEPQVDIPIITEQATLPFNLVRNKLENLTVGTSCYVAPNAVRVDAKRKCWLHPLALTGVKSTERSIQVKRDSSGYHVVLAGTEHQWEAEDLNTSAGVWIPVRSIAME